MTIYELLELMHEVAELTHTRVCLGIQVSRDGSGRSTPGTSDDDTRVTMCEFGPHSLRWENTGDGNKKLCETLRFKVEQYRLESDSPDTQLTIGCLTFNTQPRGK